MLGQSVVTLRVDACEAANNPETQSEWHFRPVPWRVITDLRRAREAARLQRRSKKMDELIKDLQERGLSEEEAKVAAAYIFEVMQDEEKRKKVMLAATSATIASAVVTGAI